MVHTEQHPTHRSAHTANLLQLTNQLITVLLEEQRRSRLKRYLPSDMPLRFS